MTERVNPLGINVVQDPDGYKLYTFHELVQPPMIALSPAAHWRHCPMTDKQTTKDIVRNFILEKIYSTSRFDLAVLAEKYEIEDEFAVAECFEHEATRINKFFGYPTYNND